MTTKYTCFDFTLKYDEAYTDAHTLGKDLAEICKPKSTFQQEEHAVLTFVSCDP